MDQGAKVDKLFNHCNLLTQTVIDDGSSSLLPKAWTFVFCQFSSSPRDAASDAIVSSAGTRRSSNSARRATSSAKSRSEKECGPKDTPVEPVSTVLSSNQSTPEAKKSGANTHPWRTPVSIANQELSDCDAQTQLTELLYKALKW